jgi:hypothetical protein
MPRPQVILDKTSRSGLLCQLTEAARDWVEVEVRYRLVVRVPEGDDSCRHPASRCETSDDFYVTSAPLIDSITVASGTDDASCQSVRPSFL